MLPNPAPRLVVTGVGAVTALGHSADATFRGLCAGENGIRAIPALEAAGYPVTIGGAVPDTERLLATYPDAATYGSRKLAYALSALDEALAAAELSTLAGTACGAYFGVETSRVPFDVTYEFYRRSGRETNSVDYRAFGSTCRDLLAADKTHNKLPAFLPRHLAARYGMAGPLLATSNACASATYAIGQAMRHLRSGRVDMAVVGSADEMLDEYMIIGFSRLKALSSNNDHPDRAVRPFDVNRDGFVLGEGGAVLVLETLEHATRRRAPVLCEIRGFAATSDGEKITACHRHGAWLAQAMRRALADGGQTPDDIDYVNAHGTSTRLNDMSESRAIAAVFGERAPTVLVNSTKSMLGHTVAAAGAIEAVVTCLSLARGICHPTRNFERPDEGCHLNYCRDHAVEAPLRGAMSNSCGFSGCNSCLTFSRYEA